MEEIGTKLEETEIKGDEPEPEPATIPPSNPRDAESEQTTVLIGVSQSTRGYPHPSQSSIHALDWVLQKLIHKKCRSEFKVNIVHVKVPDEDGSDEVDSIYATSADIHATKRKDMKKCLELLSVFVNKCKEAEVPVEGWVKVGDPKEVVCAEVLRVKPDLLILGSRGLGPLQRIFVGGVSRHCSKNVECPILIIKRNPSEMPDDASED